MFAAFFERMAFQWYYRAAALQRANCLSAHQFSLAFLYFVCRLNTSVIDFIPSCNWWFRLVCRRVCCVAVLRFISVIRLEFKVIQDCSGQVRQVTDVGVHTCGFNTQEATSLPLHSFPMKLAWWIDSHLASSSQATSKVLACKSSSLVM